jgi:hypothetical protein
LRISKQDRTGSKEGSIEHQKKMILNWLHDQQFLQEEENVPQKNYLTDNKNNPTNKYTDTGCNVKLIFSIDDVEYTIERFVGNGNGLNLLKRKL